MSRSYGRIACSIWDDDDDFLELSVGAQRTYLMLTSQKDVSACGTLPLTIRRWAKRIRAEERHMLDSWLAELETERFIFMDIDTEELLIRTFVKHDGGHTNAKRVLAIHGASIALRSPILRAELAAHMRSLGLEPRFTVPNDVSAGESPIGYPIDTPSDSRRVVVTKVSSSTSTREPETSTREPTHNDADDDLLLSAPEQNGVVAATPRKRGHRLPADFQVTDSMRLWANETTPGVDIERATMKFRNHWATQTGRNAAKLDWDRAWQNWLLGDYEKIPIHLRQQPRRELARTGSSRRAAY